MQNTVKKTGKKTPGLNDNETYADLLLKFPPRPITSVAQLEATQEVIDSLIDSLIYKSELTPDERDYLNVLGTLVYEYEQIHEPMPEMSAIAFLKQLMVESNLKQKDLVPIFKTESIVSEILSGKRKLTVNHIKKLAEFFHMPVAVFID
jgi:HTH-type transcriptional regulator / antitoxin HigA